MAARLIAEHTLTTVGLNITHARWRDRNRYMTYERRASRVAHDTVR